MNRMRLALEEMDHAYNFVQDGRFLDLGCCPGGFATYVLSKWPNATGLGISLPREYGGHSLAVPATLRGRLEVCFEDLTMFNFIPSSIDGVWDPTLFSPSLIAPGDHSFDFVIADGHLDGRMLTDNPRAGWCRDRLIISQLLIALRGIKPTGSLLIKQSLLVSPELTKRIVLALQQLTDVPVQAIKPMSIYADKPTFYILARSLDSNGCDILARKLEGLWYFMTFFGTSGFGRRMNSNEINIIATTRQVNAARDFLHSLLAPINEVYQASQV